MVSSQFTKAIRAFDVLRSASRRMRVRAVNGDRPLAYIGAAYSDNLGDRVVYDAARQILPGAPLLVSEGAAREKRFAAVGLSGGRYFRAGVLGGGTLINDYSRAIVEALLSTGVPMFALGTGAGSGGWDQPGTPDLSRWCSLLERFEKVGVRGPLSRSALERIGFKGAEVVGDLALACTRDAHNGSRRRRVMINTIEKGPAERWNPEIYDALRLFLRELVGKGWEVLPFAMQRDDLRALRALLDGSGIPTMDPRYANSPEAVISDAAESQLVVSMRLHGVVLGVCGGAACVSLGYRDKCMDFMQSVGLDGALLSVDTTGEAPMLAAALHERAVRARDLRSTSIERALQYRELLRQHAAEVLAYSRST